MIIKKKHTHTHRLRSRDDRQFFVDQYCLYQGDALFWKRKWKLIVLQMCRLTFCRHFALLRFLVFFRFVFMTYNKHDRVRIYKLANPPAWRTKRLASAKCLEDTEFFVIRRWGIDPNQWEWETKRNRGKRNRGCKHHEIVGLYWCPESLMSNLKV